MASCASCQAPITWAVSDATGKRIPLDRAAVPDGNVVITGTKDGSPVAHVLGKGEDAAAFGDRYRSHFATCPDAKGWRAPAAGAKRGRR